jgi:beta-ketodecanoyl-[acyl-carrier-protein] synthase
LQTFSNVLFHKYASARHADAIKKQAGKNMSHSAHGAIPVISATGLFTPEDTISNAELVASFNAYADRYNAVHPEAEPLTHSSVEFVEKASGIKSRHVMDKTAILDPDIMEPRYAERSNDQISLMAEIGVAACRDALAKAGRDIADVDAVLCAASNMQRAYPAMAVEIQHELGMQRGFGFDMNVACSSATFGIQTAADYIRSGNARSVLVVNPEITSGHLNWRDRDSHFIFGDVATAILVEAKDLAPAQHWEILGTRLKTQFSNNIRNNFGFLNRAHGNGPVDQSGPRNDKLFVQEGRKVFKEVVPMVGQMILEHAESLGLSGADLRRLWLHQANTGMNRLIAQKVLGHEAVEGESPTVLDTYANTSSAGSIIAFHKHNQDLKAGDLGLICSFGAGYSAGSVFVRKVG